MVAGWHEMEVEMMRSVVADLVTQDPERAEQVAVMMVDMVIVVLAVLPVEPVERVENTWEDYREDKLAVIWQDQSI